MLSSPPYLGCPRKWHFGIPRNTEVISGAIPAKFRGIPRNFAGIEQKSLQKSKNSAEFRVGGIPWTPYPYLEIQEKIFVSIQVNK